MLQRKPLNNNTSWYWSAAGAVWRTATGAGITESTQTLFIPGSAGLVRKRAMQFRNLLFHLFRIAVRLRRLSEWIFCQRIPSASRPRRKILEIGYDRWYVLLFKKYIVMIVYYSVFWHSYQIIFYFFFKKSGISSSFWASIDLLLPNHVSFHSRSFWSTVSCDIMFQSNPPTKS